MSYKLIDRYIVYDRHYNLCNSEFFGVQTYNNIVRIPFGSYSTGDKIAFLFWDFKHMRVQEYKNGEVINTFPIHFVIDEQFN